MYRYHLFFGLILLAYACTQPAPPPKPTLTAVTALGRNAPVQRLNPVLSLAQMDSFIHLKGRPVTASLWKLINVDQIAGMPDTVGTLSGNLDQDRENEMVIWYVDSIRIWGRALCFDKKGPDWHFVGETILDFWHGRRLPYIDSQLGALVTYSHGWGSNYRSEVLDFYLYKDSLIDVLVLTIEERVGHLDVAPSSRLVKGEYKVINKSKIIVNYLFELSSTEEEHKNKVFFRRRFTIPYFWDKNKKQFLPRFSKKFAHLYGSHREHSEYEFDGYFDAQLNKIYKTGPMWMRYALGLYHE